MLCTIYRPTLKMFRQNVQVPFPRRADGDSYLSIFPHNVRKEVCSDALRHKDTAVPWVDLHNLHVAQLNKPIHTQNTDDVHIQTHLHSDSDNGYKHTEIS